ncbi:MAG: hypothetical protein AAGG68_21845 [Bacteroidota bacterium]
MKLFITIVICFSVLTFASAQETALKGYQENSIYLQQGFWGYKYVKKGQIYRRGFNASRLKKELEVSPNAIIEFEKYQTNKWLAAGVGVGSYILMLSSFSDSNGNANINWNTYFISLGGFVTSALLARNSRNKLQKSVWLYNQDILR